VLLMTTKNIVHVPAFVIHLQQLGRCRSSCSSSQACSLVDPTLKFQQQQQITEECDSFLEVVSASTSLMRFVSCNAVSLRVAQRLLVSIDGSLIRFDPQGEMGGPKLDRNYLAFNQETLKNN
jgi:hypothetical protein